MAASRTNDATEITAHRGPDVPSPMLADGRFRPCSDAFRPRPAAATMSTAPGEALESARTTGRVA